MISTPGEQQEPIGGAAAVAQRLLRVLDPDGGLAVVRDGARTIMAVRPDAVVTASGAGGLAALDALGPGWWAGFLSYDLGRAVERVPRLTTGDPELPDLVLARFDARAVIEPDGSVRLSGGGPGRTLLEQAIREDPPSPPRPVALHRPSSSLDRTAYEWRVRRTLEHIRAGDCYQLNLTRRLEWPSAADPVSLFCSVLRHNPAPHAALIALPSVAVVSASPERFLRRERSWVQTRPIKGTGTDPAALAQSGKDRAENVMIVDLARNDLGRVCRYGSVEVTELCGLEAHPGLYHLVSTVDGELVPGVTNSELLRATFPPASITGAPKPRVMEIIEQLEPVRRGVYCGAVGWIDTANHSLDLSVAIRTFTVTGGRTFLGVGGGIVADSDPGAEWQETELKASRLLELASGAPRLPRLPAAGRAAT